MRRSAIITTAALLLIIAALFRRGGDENERAEIKPSPKAQPLSALSKTGVGSALPRRSAKIVPAEPVERAFDPYEEWRLAKVLDHFMVPPGRFEADDLAAALTRLEAIYQEHSGGRSLDLRVDGVRDLGGGVAFDHGNIPFAQLLKLVAAIGGFSVEVGEAGVVFSPSESAENPDELVTLVSNPDPFGESPPPAPDPRQAFAEYGYVISDEVGIEIDQAAGTWTLTGSAAEIERITAFQDAMAPSALMAQVQLNQKILAAKNGQSIDLQTFADEASFSEAMAELLANPNFEIVSAPSLVTRADQLATIEIIREVLYPVAHDAAGNPTQFEMMPVGLAIPMNAILAGLDRVQLEGATELTGFKGQSIDVVVGQELQQHANASPDANLSADSFQFHAADFEGQLLDGNTAVVLAAEQGGTSVYHFISARRIGPDGQPLLRP